MPRFPVDVHPAIRSKAAAKARDPFRMREKWFMVFPPLIRTTVFRGHDKKPDCSSFPHLCPPDRERALTDPWFWL
jgi:hypothetical protein